jgi:hypothetical protein
MTRRTLGLLVTLAIGPLEDHRHIEHGGPSRGWPRDQPPAPSRHRHPTECRTHLTDAP